MINNKREIVLSISEWCSTVGFPAVGDIRMPEHKE
jgi:hypothetical protein